MPALPPRASCSTSTPRRTRRGGSPTAPTPQHAASPPLDALARLAKKGVGTNLSRVEGEMLRQGRTLSGHKVDCLRWVLASTQHSILATQSGDTVSVHVRGPGTEVRHLLVDVSVTDAATFLRTAKVCHGDRDPSDPTVRTPSRLVSFQR